MTKLYSLLGGLLFMYSGISSAQVGVGTTTPHESSILEVKSTTKGFLMPRMTTYERNQITTPTEGLMVYNTDRGAIQFYRENIGTGSNLNGWYDTQCNQDVAVAFAAFPTGITLDFSDLTQNGLMYSEQAPPSPASQLTSASANNSVVGSIGPFLSDISDPASAVTYLNFINKTQEVGDLTTQTGDHRFRFINNEEPNTYNASTFLSRTHSRSTNNGDRLEATLTPYSGNFDIILVAKFDAYTISTKDSYFSTGVTGTPGGLFLGKGNNSSDCGREFLTLYFSNSGPLCGSLTNNKVPVDLEFHRFRIKHTEETTGNATVEFYIDGKLVDTYTNSNINDAQITLLNLFVNRGLGSYSKSSIAYLGIYSDHLTESNFITLDKYLACKFESQP